MDSIYFLIPLAILLGLFFLGGFVWSVRSGQMDDLETPGRRAVFDEPEPLKDDDRPEAD